MKEAKKYLIHQDGVEYDIYNLPKGFVVKGDINFEDQDIDELPDLSSVTVKGNFTCRWTKITSLKGAPKEVEGNFDCSYNKHLTSLEGAPEKVGGNFDCEATKITSLEGAPKEVGGDFVFNRRSITSLKGAPEKVGGNFDCSCSNLTSLEGAPKEVGGTFYCNDTNITSLKGAPKKIGGDFYCSDTNVSLREKTLDTLRRGLRRYRWQSALLALAVANTIISGTTNENTAPMNKDETSISKEVLPTKNDTPPTFIRIDPKKGGR